MVHFGYRGSPLDIFPNDSIHENAASQRLGRDGVGQLTGLSQSLSVCLTQSIQVHTSLEAAAASLDTFTVDKSMGTLEAELSWDHGHLCLGTVCMTVSARIIERDSSGGASGCHVCATCCCWNWLLMCL